MEKLFEKSNILIQNQSLAFIRSLYDRIDWQDRLIGILGSRGTGKTTLLLQRVKQTFGPGTQAIYLSLDDIYFTENRLIDFAETFRQQGGKLLLLDEVHRYPNWAREIKNIYDFYKDIQIVFTGSSVIDMLRQNADLSRRAMQYELTGLSFREYLDLSGIGRFPAVSFTEILVGHTGIAAELTTKFKPLQYFKEYLSIGYFPFFTENKFTYPYRLEQVIRLIIETDLQFVKGYDPHNSRKIYQLLYLLAVNVPFKPNISQLSGKIGLHRNTLLEYLHFLEKARLANALTATGKSTSTLQKPDKLFLENTNLHHALAPGIVDKGTIRESFFLNQLRNKGHTLSLPVAGDFFLDDTYTVEIGGKGKSSSQISGIPDSWIAADDMEIGASRKIPLWLFGFLY